MPFARFAAQHIGQLGIPFKRYHIGPVWRGENTQHGRYREFYQCDCDTIGTDSNAADIETALVIHDILAALGFERFAIHVNNRLILNGLLESLGLQANTAAILRALDKLAKIGTEKVSAEMRDIASITPDQARQILDIVQVKGTNSAILDQLEAQLGDHERAAQGVANLRQLLVAFAAAGIPEHRLIIDISIARGLDYYTGTVYETLLDDLPGIGSICSGGRYDNLAGLYTKQHLPGVGASLGLDRLMAAMEELNLLVESTTPADVFIVQFAEELFGKYIALSRRLRSAGLGAELYPEAKGIGKQLKYADRKGYALAIIGGPDELIQGVWQVKDLREGSSEKISDGDLLEYLLKKA